MNKSNINIEMIIVRLEEGLYDDLKSLARAYKMSPESYATKVLIDHIRAQKIERDKQLKLIKD